MISDVVVARRISDLMLDVSGKLNDSILDVVRSSPEDAENYKRAIGFLLGGILLDVLNPLYKAHPDLKPAELK
ncbi:hypothetical protein [Rudaea sp.]|uniref:hypothetical protein n=1 Tax=Rudaea sp. TaxID=2136325 RepID=UPI0037839829